VVFRLACIACVAPHHGFDTDELNGEYDEKPSAGPLAAAVLERVLRQLAQGYDDRLSDLDGEIGLLRSAARARSHSAGRQPCSRLTLHSDLRFRSRLL
jgi:hypothetical protein